jgi:uncharacterized protein involved in outer membrane biogenesis
MKKSLFNKLALGVLICLIIYTVVGFLVLPLIVKPVLTDKLAQLLQRDVSIEKIRTNPYSLSLTVGGIEIKERESSEILAAWSEFYVNLQSFSSLVKRAIVVKELYLREPFLRIERDTTGDMNILPLFPRTEGEDSPDDSNEEATEEGLAIRVDLIELEGGEILFSDSSRPETFQTTLRPISFYLLNLDTTGESESDFKLSLESERGEEITLQGSFRLNPLVSEGTVEIRDLSAPKYSPYYGDMVAFDIEEGSLTVRTEYSYDGSRESTATQLANLSLSLREALLRQETLEFFKVDTFLVENTAIDLNKKTIEIGNMSTSKGELTLVRESDGTLNVSTLVPPTDGEEKIEENVDDESPWIVTVKTLSTDGYTVTFEDRSTGQPVIVKLENVELAGENISTEKESRGHLRLDFREQLGGTFSTEGTVGVNPLFADFSMKLSDFHITPFQPYVSEVADLIIQKGGISTEGNLIVEEGEEGIPSLTFKANVALADFTSADSVKGEDFFNFTSLSFDKVNLHYNPNSLEMGEISLSDFYAKITINADQTLNVGEIFRSEKGEGETPAVKEETEGKEEPFFERIDLGTVRLKNGRINFTDRFIKPSYTADLFEIGGSISGLVSEETALADVDLSGKLNKTIPLTITGTTNPLKEDFFADLTIKFENIELGPLTPYSQKHLGYPIDKGKLFLNLTYKIDKRTIESDNKIFIDQFTLGDAVESPDAIKLPVKLAISLLQNRKGEIDLDVPVSGSLDDPEFSVGYFIFKIIGNIIEKAVTSPFALIGGLAGGGEELGYAEFDYGSATITAEVTEKLNKLDEALYSRPLLKLEIEGHADTVSDMAMLKKALLEKKIKAAKLKDNASRGLPAISLEEIVIAPEEYETYLAMAYEEEGLPKPEGEKMVEEMERRLSDTITVTDDDLRQLAYQRASMIRDYILASGKVEKERIFLLEPKSLMPEKRENIKDSRVDFNLK